MRRLFVRVAFRAALIVAVAQVAAMAVFLWWDHRAATDRERDHQAAVIAAVVAVTTDKDALRTTLTRSSPSGRLALHLIGEDRIGPSWASEADVAEVMRRRAPLMVKARGGDLFLTPVPAAGGGIAVVEIHLPDAGLDSRQLAGTGAFALIGLVAAAVAAIAADRRTAPVVEQIRDLGTAATSADATQLAYRQAATTVPELAKIATMINRVGVLARQLADRERKMIADLSHRLRTPLTALRLDVDAVGSGQVAERIRSAVTSLEQDVGDIIRAASRPPEPAQPAVSTSDLTEVVRRRMQFWQVLAVNQNRRCDVSYPDTPAPVDLAEDDVADIVNNLVGNVLRHTDPGTPMAVTVGQHAGWISLVVDDGGPGIADPQKSLRRGVSGGGSSGLGLDIVRTKVEVAGGAIYIERGKLGGARIRLRFAEAGQPHQGKPPLAWRLWRGRQQ